MADDDHSTSVLSKDTRTKRCLDCKQTKSASALSLNSSRPDKLMLYCKPCMSLRYKAHYKKPPKSPPPVGSTKRCGKCRIVKPSSEFGPSRGTKTGLKSSCRECANATLKVAYQADPDKARLRRRSAYWSNPEAERQKHKIWVEANRTEITERRKVYVSKNKGKVASYRRSYYHKNRVRLIEYSKNWKNINPTAYRVIVHTRNRNRINKLRGADGRLSSAEWMEIQHNFNYSCAYCLRHATELDTPLEVEHMVPISRGGTAFPSNVVPSCRSCNRSKLNKTPMEFLSYLCTRAAILKAA
jgi:5-methylcytosine-specific restriction endonuclease McrA